ncbi:glycosyl transferase [Amycolatopsis mediterranei S699]|uniref:dolichyl-phosphate beta-glucosyltransferase n=2 Tax=Amycolatopsis mediterranei TaxID=33910 RepID=A0A0H3DE25_AMYMU|nr:bifunctional glycosyltransferase family 2/GtrA family protein [Amycolatopsis mediterranei]ADJ48482.1 glycosyl transferase family protein [Amycolatopsis mediterranei U32]AEK45406.1 glycosyl transferase [Amycolatopsis mediterranei S699]AFO80193.1 glycosyl transferase [Amycolatopsis mediterranei S699]AGT87321.1 glycosyl transferase [Amycolatopsis mediterranei RB]KDO10999.1 sugar translocase [Amycolatopsis mediterranei]
MTATAPASRPGTGPVDLAGPRPVLDVVIPVYNEETDLEPCIRRLHAHLAEHVSYPYRITVADNASTDATLQVAERLAREFPEVAVRHLDEKGRGRALNAVWQASDAAVLAYMDVDLSTDLAALGPLVAPLLSGHSELAIGSRLARGARVVRGPKREFISRCYNLILRSTLAAKFSDAQCGFKAIRADVARELLPHVVDTGWFFDTELLVLAQRAGLRIHEVPVDWVDDPDSSVNIVKTATEDLKGIARVTKATFTGEIPVSRLREQLGRQPIGVDAPGVPPRLVTQLVRFAAIGVSSTLAYLVLFLLLRTVVGAQPANFAALLVTAVGNTALNRRLTFGIRGRAGAGRHQFEGLLVFGLGLALTSGSLALLNGSTAPGLVLELTVLVLANLAATVLRFLLLRGWVFNPRRQATTQKEF